MWYFLKEDEQLLVNTFTSRYVINGPGRHFIAPYHRVKRRAGITLSPTRYLRVRSTLTGEIRTVTGPRLFFPDAHDTILDELEAITLKKGQYVQVIDDVTGVIRVFEGEASLFLSPTERLLSDVRSGVNVDDEHAVLVRSVETGQQSLITEKQVFIPGADQEVVQVQERVQLEDHETVVVREKDGRYTFIGASAASSTDRVVGGG